MGVAVIGLLLWLAVTRLLGGPGQSDVVAVLEPSGSGVFDVYLVDGVPDPGSQPSRDDLYLRDVAVGGFFLSGEGEEVSTFDSFDLTVDGKPLFAYREEDDTDWSLAVVDGDQPKVIQSFDSEPLVYRLGSRTIIVDALDGSSCGVYALDGLTSNRLERADFCSLNTELETMLMADGGSSGSQIWLLPLDAGKRTDLVEIDSGSTFSAFYSASGKSVVVSEVDSDGTGAEAWLFDAGSGERRAEASAQAVAATDDGFFGLDATSGGSSTLVYVNNEGQHEIPTPDDVSTVKLSPDGSTLLVVSNDGSDVVVSTAPVGSDGAGELVEIDVLDSPGSAEFLSDGSLFLTGGRSVRLKRGDQAPEEVGDLGSDASFGNSVFEIGDLAVLSASTEDRSVVAVVKPGGDPAFAEVKGLSQVSNVLISPDREWYAVWGSGDDDSGRDLLVLVDSRTLETVEVDQVDNLVDAQFNGKYIYFVTSGEESDDVETHRFEVGGRGVTEDVSNGSRFLLPGVKASGLHRTGDIEFATVS